MMSLDSCDSRELTARGAADIRRRLSETVNAPKTGFKRDPEDPSAAALKEPWEDKVLVVCGLFEMVKTFSGTF